MLDNINFRSIHRKNKTIAINYINLIFLLFFNLHLIYCEDIQCKSDKSLQNKNCFNNLLIFNNKKYRAGHFATKKNGDLIIEFSEDNHRFNCSRLFYGLKRDGQYYFDNNMPTYELNITGGNIVNVGRYESRNLFVSLENDDGNEYLFSVSSYHSVVELHKSTNQFDENYIWTAKNFFGFSEDYIYSYEFSLFEINSESTYIIVFIPRKLNSATDMSDSFIIKKFKFQDFNSDAYKSINSSAYENNYNNRIISAFNMNNYNVFFVFFVDKVSIHDSQCNCNVDAGKYTIKIYNYDINCLKTHSLDGSYRNLKSGDGIFFKSFQLYDMYTAYIYFTEENVGKSLIFQILKLTNNENNYQLEELINYSINEYNFYTYVSLSDFLKIDKRIAFISTEGSNERDERKLYFLLFDLYDTYSKMKIRVYIYNINNYIFQKELSGYVYNGYLLFDATVITAKESMEDKDWIDFFSIFMIIGYSNGTDNTFDISSLFSDGDNYDISINFTSFLYDNLTIDNNIFGYIPDSQIFLVSIPDEILIYKENSNVHLENNSYLNISDKLTFLQNKNIKKTSQYYYIDYQYIIREPDYTEFYNNTHTTINYNDSYDYENEFKPRKFYGKTNRLKFKLCHDFCESCKEIGSSNSGQKCSSCLPIYQYDYWFYKGNPLENCAPEG